MRSAVCAAAPAQVYDEAPHLLATHPAVTALLRYFFCVKGKSQQEEKGLMVDGLINPSPL